MNPVIMRRANWLVATLAFGYACFAFLEWRLTELLVATGVLIVCIPFEIGLRHEVRVARGESPWGPVNRWGLRK